MFYIGVQALDYDDYPVGSETKIGPFYSDKAAADFMGQSSMFYRRVIFGDYSEWKVAQFGKHSVTIKSVTDGMVSPSRWA